MANELIQLRVVHGLMVAAGNLDHMASQRHASISLEVSMVVHEGRHCSTGSAPRAPERKGSLHCGVFAKHSTQRLIHKGGSDTSVWKEVFPLLSATHHKYIAGKPMLTLTPLFYPQTCCE